MKRLLFLSFCLLSCFSLTGCKGCRREEKVAEKKLKIVRPPAVAGAFYPGTKTELEAQIEEFFNNVPETKEEKALRILIVPHAGYEYSGQVAAFGFKQILSQDYSTVVILGPSHQAYFSQVAVFDQGVWETPLGKVAIDEKLAKKIIDEGSQIVALREPHQNEHCLEVEVPFLQKTLKKFEIVPILLSEVNPQLLEDLASALAKHIDEKTLVVISTDLSHYPSYETAKEVDNKTIEAILTGDEKAFVATISAQMEKGYPNLATCACGEKAVRVGMILAKKLGISDIKLLKYANSGDVSGDKSRVVGYAAIGFWLTSDGGRVERSETSDSSEVGDLGRKQQKQLLEIARKTLESYLSKKKIPKFEVDNPQLNQKLGAFVTLRKQGQLRGCIGRFEPDESLWKIIQEMAVSSATKDLRFPPVELSELEDIKIEISVLSPRRKIDDWHEIELGKHGVYIQKGTRGGVFLPQVATENNWDLDTFMGTLCTQKAGLPRDCWKEKDVDLFVFTAQVFEEE